MKSITAIIEKGNDGGYSIYAENQEIPVFGNGLTEEEARQEFESCLHEQAAYMKVLGLLPNGIQRRFVLSTSMI